MRSLSTPIVYSNTYSSDHVTPTRTPLKKHLYLQKFPISVFPTLGPPNITSTVKRMLWSQELRRLLPLLEPDNVHKHLEGAEKFCLKGAGLNCSTECFPISNFTFYFTFLFNELMSLTLCEKTLFEPCLSHLPIQHCGLCLVPRLYRTEMCCCGLGMYHKLGLDSLLLK